MKKIYTVTFQRALNYGAVLQAYALMKFLQAHRFDVEVLDYAPHYFLIQNYRPSKGIKKSWDKYKKLNKFKEFRDKFLNLTPKTYYGLRQLKNLPQADFAVCGSDQIWNYNLTDGKLDPTFYLDFAPHNTKRIAYAASAGSIRLNKLKAAAAYIEKFDNIGTREAILAHDVKELVPNSSPQIVVDPCLLLSNYDEVLDTSRLPEGEYIVSYVVGSGEMLTEFDSQIQLVKSRCKLPIIHIGAKSIPSADKNILDIGPSEWAAFIKNARHVVTNSFHGVAFSLNFRKNFVFIPHVIENLNARQETLLNAVGLAGQTIEHCSNAADVLLNDIDYSTPAEKLSEIVGKSRDYLLKALT